jgi:hypothetical protein
MLHQLFGRMRQADQTWCCESCREAAQARGHGAAHQETDSAADPGLKPATPKNPGAPTGEASPNRPRADQAFAPRP